MNIIKLINDRASRNIIAFLRREGNTEMVDFLKQNHELQFASVPDHVPYFTKETLIIEQSRANYIDRDMVFPVPIYKYELNILAEENNLRLISLDEYVGLVDEKELKIPKNAVFQYVKKQFKMIGTPNAFMDIVEGREPREPIVLLSTPFSSYDFYHVIGHYGPVHNLSKFQAFRLKMNTEKCLFPKLLGIGLLLSFLFGQSIVGNGWGWTAAMLAWLLYNIACFAYRLEGSFCTMPKRRIPSWALFF
jgi:hypothetical protein